MLFDCCPAPWFRPRGSGPSGSGLSSSGLSSSGPMCIRQPLRFTEERMISCGRCLYAGILLARILFTRILLRSVLV